MPVKIYKKLALTLLSVFLCYQTIGLLGWLLQAPNTALTSSASFFTAALFNLYVTGIFAFLGFAFSTSNFLPQGYYKIYKPMRLKLWSERLRLELFKAFLLNTFWRNSNKRKTFFNGKKEGLNAMLFETRQAEFGHLAAGIVLLLIAGFLSILQHWLMAFFITLMNLVLNGYPVLLQRNHRLRLAFFTDRKNE